ATDTPNRAPRGLPAVSPPFPCTPEQQPLPYTTVTIDTIAAFGTEGRPSHAPFVAPPPAARAIAARVHGPPPWRRRPDPARAPPPAAGAIAAGVPGPPPWRRRPEPARGPRPALRRRPRGHSPLPLRRLHRHRPGGRVLRSADAFLRGDRRPTTARGSAPAPG